MERFGGYFWLAVRANRLHPHMSATAGSCDWVGVGVKVER